MSSIVNGNAWLYMYLDLVFGFMSLYIFGEESSRPSAPVIYTVLLVLSYAVLTVLIILILFNFTFGTVIVEKEGVTFRTLVRKKRINYDECEEIGLCQRKRFFAPTSWVVYIKKKKTEISDAECAWKKRADVFRICPSKGQDYVTFDYYEDTYKELKTHVPKQFSDRLITEEKSRIYGLSGLGVCTTNEEDPCIIHEHKTEYPAATDKLRKSIINPRIFFIIFIGVPPIIMATKIEDNQWKSSNLLAIYMLFTLVVLMIIRFLQLVFTNPLMGKFSFDEDKIVFLTAAKSYAFRYEDCHSVKIISIPYNYAKGGQGEGKAIFVCLAKDKTISEKDLGMFVKSRWMAKLLNKPRLTSDYIMFECYDYDVFRTFAHYVPERLRSQLMEERERLLNT